MSPADLTRVASRTCGQSPADRYDTTPLCHPELPFTSHKRGIDETWDPAWGAGNSAFQTAAKDLSPTSGQSPADMYDTTPLCHPERMSRSPERSEGEGSLADFWAITRVVNLDTIER